MANGQPVTAGPLAQMMGVPKYRVFLRMGIAVKEKLVRACGQSRGWLPYEDVSSDPVTAVVECLDRLGGEKQVGTAAVASYLGLQNDTALLDRLKKAAKQGRIRACGNRYWLPLGGRLEFSRRKKNTQ